MRAFFAASLISFAALASVALLAVFFATVLSVALGTLGVTFSPLACLAFLAVASLVFAAPVAIALKLEGGKERHRFSSSQSSGANAVGHGAG